MKPESLLPYAQEPDEPSQDRSPLLFFYIRFWYYPPIYA
jgi:hypothetical protein